MVPTVHLKRLPCLLAICGVLALSSLWLTDGKEVSHAVTFLWATRVSFLVSIFFMGSELMDIPKEQVKVKLTMSMENTLVLCALSGNCVLFSTVGLFQSTQHYTTLFVIGLFILEAHDLWHKHYSEKTQLALHIASMTLATAAQLTDLPPLYNTDLISTTISIAILCPFVWYTLRATRSDNDLVVPVLQLLQLSSPYLFASTLTLNTLFFHSSEPGLEWSLQTCTACVVAAACAILGVFACFKCTEMYVTSDFLVALSMTTSLRHAYISGATVACIVSLCASSIAVVCMVVCMWVFERHNVPLPDAHPETQASV
jgi:hypothetical protein